MTKSRDIGRGIPGGHKPGSGPKESYPWDSWFDGRPHPIHRKDFPRATTTTFRVLAYRAAARRGVRVIVNVNGDLVTIRAVRK